MAVQCFLSTSRGLSLAALAAGIQDAPTERMSVTAPIKAVTVQRIFTGICWR